MSEIHNPLYRNGRVWVGECTCGWVAYGARYAYEAEEDLRRHIEEEQRKAQAAKEVEKERIRLLTQGQNWDTP